MLDMLGSKHLEKVKLRRTGRKLVDPSGGFRVRQIHYDSTVVGSTI